MVHRCRPGDLALVIYDEPGCIDNVGRVVRVRGPVLWSVHYEMNCWLIRPVARRLYCVEHEGSIRRYVVAWKDRVEHQDSWLLPLRGLREIAPSATYCTIPAVDWDAAAAAALAKYALRTSADQREPKR